MGFTEESYSPGGFAPGSYTKLPGTGQNVVADALIGFAKGFAERQAKEREEKASNQRAVLQAMIQQEMVSPAGKGSTPDFSALGYGWNYEGGGMKKRLQEAQMQNYEAEAAKTKIETEKLTDPGAWVQSQMDSWEKQNSLLMLTHPDQYPAAYKAEYEKNMALAKSGQISYLKPFPSTPQSTQASTPQDSFMAKQQSWMDENIRNPVASALAAFTQSDQKTDSGVTPPLPKVNPSTGKTELWYKVKDKKSGKVGFVTQEELAVNPDLVRA